MDIHGLRGSEEHSREILSQLGESLNHWEQTVSGNPVLVRAYKEDVIKSIEIEVAKW